MNSQEIAISISKVFSFFKYKNQRTLVSSINTKDILITFKYGKLNKYFNELKKENKRNILQNTNKKKRVDIFSLIIFF